MTLGEITKQIEENGRTKEEKARILRKNRAQLLEGIHGKQQSRTLFGRGKLNELHTQSMPGKKAMAAMATNEGDIWDYMNGGTGGGKSIKEKALPVICITTTAGTGSEADQWGVITN